MADAERILIAGALLSAALAASLVAGRLRLPGLVLFTRVPDRPGSLARLLSLVGEAGGNPIHVEHLREGIDLHVRETAVQLTLETRGRDHAHEVVACVRDAGYEQQIIA